MRDMGTIKLINGQSNRGRHPNLRQKEKARSKRESNDEGQEQLFGKTEKLRSVHIRKQQARNIRRSFKVKKFYTYQKVEGREIIH